jgi:hypothetical protein
MSASWGYNNKKDLELGELSQQVVQVMKAQAAATLKVETALVCLQRAIAVLGRREGRRGSSSTAAAKFFFTQSDIPPDSVFGDDTFHRGASILHFCGRD